MDINALLKPLNESIAKLSKKQEDNHPLDKLELEVDQAWQDWQQALQDFNYADSDLVDIAVIKVHVMEKNYIKRLSEAKEEGTVAWPEFSQDAVPKATTNMLP